MCRKVVKAVFALLLLFVVSCRVEMPKDVPSPDKMEAVLYDYHLAQTMATTLSTSDYKEKLLYKAVFKKHGMTKEELEQNLGTIAKSGSLKFKQDMEKSEDIDIIGQFGVGFYSAFMVASSITVISRKYGEDTAWQWESDGADGYTVTARETIPVLLLDVPYLLSDNSMFLKKGETIHISKVYCLSLHTTTKEESVHG